MKGISTSQRDMDLEGVRVTSYRLDRLGEPKLAQALRDVYFRQTGKQVPR